MKVTLRFLAHATEGLFKPTPSRLQQQLAVWEGRLGRPAVEALEQGKVLFRTAYIGAVGMVALFVVFTLLHSPAVAVVCMILAFGIDVPMLILASVSMTRMEKFVSAKYGLNRPLRPPLSFRVLRTPEGFDRWLLLLPRN